MSSETWTIREIEEAFYRAGIVEAKKISMRSALEDILAARRSQPEVAPVGREHGPGKCVPLLPRVDRPPITVDDDESEYPADHAKAKAGAEQPAAPPSQIEVDIMDGNFGPIADPPAPVAASPFDKALAGATEALSHVGTTRTELHREGPRSYETTTSKPPVAPANPQPGVQVVVAATSVSSGSENPSTGVSNSRNSDASRGLGERMRADRMELRALLLKSPGVGGELGTLARFIDHEHAVDILEAANAELRAQTIRWEQQIQDSAKAHERLLSEARADNDRLQREVVSAGNERDARDIRIDELVRFLEVRAKVLVAMEKQLDNRDARIAGLEASSADLVRRAQEEGRLREETADALAKVTVRAQDAEELVAELRGKLAAAEAIDCPGCLALLSRAADMLAEVQEEPDGLHEWQEDLAKHRAPAPEVG